MKRTVFAIFASLALVFMSGAPIALGQQEVCGDLDSGKIDTTGDPNSVTVTAPDGFLISGYCVKAGSDQSTTNGAVSYVTVDPPQKTVVITHYSGKDVSHYSYSLVPEEVQELYWCSPGFWKTRQGTLSGTAYDPAGFLNDQVPGGSGYTIGYALANPSVVKGGVFNAAANYLSGIFFAPNAGTQSSGENCPIDAHGNWID